MKGPKGMLSNAIADALGAYFVVDPHDIQTNLVTDAGVTLHHVQLQPIVSAVVATQPSSSPSQHGRMTTSSMTVADVTGTVESVSFHWEWGSEVEDKAGGSSWVKNATLEMSGLSFCAVLRSVNDDDDKKTGNNDSVTPTTNSSSSTTAPIGGLKGYMKDQVNRIMDALTLSVQDFRFELVLANDSDHSTAVTESVIFGGQGVELESLGRHMEELTQTLTIQKIYSLLHVSSSADATETTSQKLPLLEPLSYTATCVRSGGHRFDSAILTGLRVTGQSSDQGVVVHAGAQQLHFLNRLGGRLVSTTAPSDDDAAGAKEDSSTAQELKDTPPPAAATSTQQHDSPSSFCELPLAGISLVLPNATKVTLAGLVFRYQMDGAVCALEGWNGIRVNDDFGLLDLGPSCMWQANVVEQEFRLGLLSSSLNAASLNKGNDNAVVVATLHARDDEIDSLKDGVRGLLDLYHDMHTEGALASVSHVTPEPDVDAAVKVVEAKVSHRENESAAQQGGAWLLSIDGDMRFLLEGTKDTVKLDCSVRNFRASQKDLTVTIGAIESLLLPGIIRLQEPLVDTTLTFDGSLLDVIVGDVVACLEEPSVDLKPSDDNHAGTLQLENDSVVQDGGDPASTPFVLPFGGKLSVRSVTIHQTDGKTNHTTVQSILFAVGPDAPPSDDAPPTGGVRVVLVMDAMNHEMIGLDGVHVSAVVYPADMSSVDQLEFDAYSVSVATGYSVWDWVRLAETGDEKRESKKVQSKDKTASTILLPNAHIEPIKVKVVVTGAVGLKDATIHVKEFVGTDKTTSNDLIRFYTSAVLKNVPGMVTNANVIGFNLYDSTAGQVGTAMGSTALASLGSAAAPVAGVLGMVGFDAVKSTIQAGKKNRGAEADDKMKVTDFFRGIGQAAGDAAQSGAKRRGKTAQEKSNAVDWAVGATSDAATYTNKNKSRFGGAGAGTMGFVYGMALGGPIGAVAGAIVASKTTSHTIDAVDGRLSRKGDAQEVNTTS